MRQAWVVAWKDLRVALDTPLGYVAAVGFLAASGFFFGKNLFLLGLAEMRPWLELVPLVLLFFAPSVGMRAISDELREGTFELLATQPVSSAAIVAGKWLAAWLQLLGWLGWALFYAASLAVLGDPDLGAIAAGILGLVALSAVYAAATLFASTLTRHAVVAYVIGFGILLALWVLDAAQRAMGAGMQAWIALVDPVSHYRTMLRGLVGLDDLLWCAAWTVAFTAGAWLKLEARRWA